MALSPDLIEQTLNRLNPTGGAINASVPAMRLALEALLNAAPEDELSKLSGVGVDLRNAEAVCNFMAAIKMAHAGPQSDLEALRSHVADVERLFDNASKVAHTGFGAITAERCARNSDAIRTAIVEIERYRALSSEPRSTPALTQDHATVRGREDSEFGQTSASTQCADAQARPTEGEP